MRFGGPYLVAGLALVLAGAALAEAPDRSPRPPLRPTEAAAPAVDSEGVTRIAVAAGAQAPALSQRPAARPGGAPGPSAAPEPSSDGVTPDPIPPSAAIAAQPAPSDALPEAVAGLRFNGNVASQFALPRSPRPAVRPDGLEQAVRAAATRTTPSRVAQPGERGALCGVSGLVGEQLAPITGSSSGCGVAEPVRLRAVDGIALSTPATINCQTARALQTWVQSSLLPNVGRTGGGVTSLRVVASYACRTRNNQRGARISEHGRGNAIDIAGIGLADGSELTVLTGWRDRRQGQILRALHSGACGPFGTVLGPNSDRFHQDHFHFDTAAHRSGPYCR